MTLKEKLNLLVENFPPPALSAILITRLLPITMTVEHNGKKFLIVHYIEWLRLENQMKWPVKKSILSESGYLPGWMGIPAYENEELVINILLSNLKD